MNEKLKKKYVEVHKQGWVPIFVKDSFDALKLAEVCVNSGFKVIEVTCRRPGVVEEIRAIRKIFPELIILVGSVVDDSFVVFPTLRTRKPDFPTMEQLADLGVDGFVALLPFSLETIRKYSGEFIMIPGVETISEGANVLNAGAHFTKYCACPPERIKEINGEATHHVFPIFYTGGASLDKIRGYIHAGAALVGGGWDLMLKDIKTEMETSFNMETASKRLLAYKQAVQDARAELNPDYAKLVLAEPDEYLRSLSHYHPFHVCQ